MLEEMKQDIQKLKRDMAEVRATERGIAAALTRIEGKADGIAEHMVTKLATKEQVDKLTKQMDDFSGVVVAARDERKIADETFSDVRKTLQDHEARLIRLEPKKA